MACRARDSLHSLLPMRAHALVAAGRRRPGRADAAPRRGGAQSQRRRGLGRRGHELMRRGDYAGARAVLRRSGRPVRRAVGAARAAAAGARRAGRRRHRHRRSHPAAAAERLSRLGSAAGGAIHAGAGAPRRRATARARCARWTPSKHAPAATAIGPYAALQRAQCAAKLGDWPGELAAARAALSIDGGGPRLTRIEALERAAEAELKLGRKQDALDFYNRSLELAGTRAYKAEMLFTTATWRARSARTPWRPSASARSSSTTPTRRARPARSMR